jgi:hypothetical protein
VRRKSRFCMADGRGGGAAAGCTQGAVAAAVRQPRPDGAGHAGRLDEPARVLVQTRGFASVFAAATPLDGHGREAYRRARRPTRPPVHPGDPHDMATPFVQPAPPAAGEVTRGVPTADGVQHLG